jgi:hypothetical protein
MPTPLIKSFAKKSNKNVSEIESMWNSVVQSLKDSGSKESDENFYPRVVGILKKNLHLTETMSFLDFKLMKELSGKQTTQTF